MKRLIASCFLAVLVCLIPMGLSAQTPTPVSGAVGQYQLGAGYTSVGGATDNGTLLTFAKQFSPRVWGVAKTFMLANPSGVMITTIGPRYRPPLAALWKPSEYLDTSKFTPFVDLNLGAVKDPTGKTTFAYGVGVGLDYQANANVTLLLIEADYDRSKFFPTGGILVTNVRAIATGLKLIF